MGLATISLDEDGMVDLIEGLLCTHDKESFAIATVQNKVTINYTGNPFCVQRRVLEWLLAPERIRNIYDKGLL